MSIRSQYWLPVDEDEWIAANLLTKARLHLRCITGLFTWNLYRRWRD